MERTSEETWKKPPALTPQEKANELYFEFDRLRCAGATTRQIMDALNRLEGFERANSVRAAE